MLISGAARALLGAAPPPRLGARQAICSRGRADSRPLPEWERRAPDWLQPAKKFQEEDPRQRLLEPRSRRCGCCLVCINGLADVPLPSFVGDANTRGGRREGIAFPGTCWGPGHVGSSADVVPCLPALLSTAAPGASGSQIGSLPCSVPPSACRTPGSSQQRPHGRPSLWAWGGQDPAKDSCHSHHACLFLGLPSRPLPPGRIRLPAAPLCVHGASHSTR